MPPVCSLCRHAERTLIDVALVEGRDSLRDIAGRYGTSKSSVERHREHVHGSLVLARKVEETTRADDLLDILRECVADSRRLRGKAEEEGDYRAAIGAVKVLCDVVEKLAAIGEKLAQAATAKPPEPKPNLTDGELAGAIERLLGAAAARKEEAHVC